MFWFEQLTGFRETGCDKTCEPRGQGAFGNDDAWIDAAMRRALDGHRACDLDVRLVSYGAADPSALAIEKDYA